jgi:hypothetical protein
MGLTCSILGHAYGEAEIERDRDEQGSEVVITIREIETCERCGESRVVSENKEVTTLETPDEPTPEPEGDQSTPSVPDEPVDDATDAAVVDADEDDGEILDDEAAAAADSLVEAPDDDADASVPDAEGGEAVAVDEATDAPATATADEPATAEGAEDDDGVILDDTEAQESESPGREPGEWPENPREAGADEEPEFIPADERGSEYGGDLAAETDLETGSSDSGPLTVAEGTYECTDCDFSTEVEASSLRPGDFCPECHSGTLEHRPGA